LREHGTVGFAKKRFTTAFLFTGLMLGSVEIRSPRRKAISRQNPNKLTCPKNMPTNPFDINTPEHPGLTEQIRRVLKSGKITATRLPLTPEIQLYLLNEDYPQHNLPREETQALMNEPPFWSFCWSSGQVLARWLMERRELVKGKHVLDFGSGSGIVAVAAALSGARKVIACDIDPVSLEAVTANADLNHVEIEVSRDFESSSPEGFDVILAADVLYDAEIFPIVRRFPDLASDVILADSRVRDLTLEPYRKIDHGVAVTCPDLQEPEEFRQVSIYAASRGS
jgi:predicted nicotinamide N-methyase